LIRKIFCLLAFIAITLVGAAKDIYVAVNGNDQNTGTIIKPFKTIQKAVLAARQYPEKVIIYIRSGNYDLSEPLLFGKLDSRNADKQLTIKAYANEYPVLTSDKILTLKWQPFKNGIYFVDVKDASLKFDQLFVNGIPMVMARYPNYKEGVLPYNGTAADAIADNRVNKWKSPEGAFIHAMHNSLWGDLAYRVTGKDASGKLTMEGGWQNNRPSAMHNKYRFVENVFEELDTLNEWYFDKQAHRLYLKPAPDVQLVEAVITSPQLESLIVFKGEAGKPVQNISIEGLKFTHTLRTFMKTREPLLRSDWCIYRGAAVLAENAAHISIVDCNLEHLGGNAILFNNYNQYNSVSSCHIENVGASAVVFVGDPKAVRSPSYNYQGGEQKDMDLTPGPIGDNYPRYCKISDNLIHQIGEVEKQTTGVQLSMCRDIEVTHNTIYDVPRAGINCNEGTWGGHFIAYNDVFNTVMETGDHGAFNSWGRDRYWLPKRSAMDSLVKVHPEMILLDAVEPTRIFNNRFRCDNGWDIDLDDGSSNYIIENNVCLSGGIKLREGFKRVVQNNIMINNSFHPHVWFKNSKDKFEHNIVSAAYQPIRITDWGMVDHNFFPDEASLKKAQVQHTDANSIFGDPLFVDASVGNYTLKASSPALASGFHNIKMDFGVTSKRLKTLAKKTPIPQLVNVVLADDQQVDFFKLKVKDLKTLAEQSATGMAEKRGVLVVSSTNASILYPEIKPNDVILAFADDRVDNIKDLFNARLKIQSKKSTTVTIFRDQKEQVVNVNIK
jgi:hypothetical protein